MAAGVTMAVIGAILAFAVRADPSGIDLRAVGLILLVAGIGLIWHERRGTTHERVATRSQYATDPHDLRSPIGRGRSVRHTQQDRE
jgi:hypothetical protein